MPIFTGEIVAFNFTTNSNSRKRGVGQVKIGLQMRLIGFSNLEIETGENIYVMPVSMELSPGEVDLQDGNLSDGCGYLMYLPASDSQDIGCTSSSVGGWCVLSEPIFDRIWNILLNGPNLQHRASFRLKGTKFIMPDTHVWETKSKQDLVITDFSVLSASSAWFEMIAHKGSAS